MDSAYNIVLAPVMAFVLTLGLIPAAKFLAKRLGYVDAPDSPGGRKQHDEPVPPIGGMVIFPVFVFAALFLGIDVAAIGPYLTALALVLVIGFIDDRWPVNAKLKFAAHFMAAIIVVVPGGAQLQSLGNMFGLGALELGWFAIPFSVACVVYLINAINMMDGIDGLAGGMSLIIVGWLTFAAFIAQDWMLVGVFATLGAALAGFLFYNMRHPFRDKASVFLGDAGSMALGLTIAWFCISVVQDPDPVLVPISVAWIIALPIIDAFGLFAMRLYEGRHPFSADRRHFHHHFIHAGFPVGHSTLLILIWGGFLGAVGYFGIAHGIPQAVLTLAWIALWIGHALVTMRPQRLINALTALRSRIPGQSSGTGHL